MGDKLADQSLGGPRFVLAGGDDIAGGGGAGAGPAGASASTPSSYPRAATARCSGWCRSSWRSRAVAIELLDSIDGFDAPIAELGADPEVEVVIHAGGQDVAILRRAWGAAGQRVRHPDGGGVRGLSAQAGYGNLLGAPRLRLGKSASFTRWDRRPLTDEQLDYARKDVEDLLGLADELQRRLDRERAARVGT